MPQQAPMDIDYVANLARIALTPAEKELFSRQLGDILHYIEKLNTVDVTGVEPTAHAIPVENVWDADVPRPCMPVARAMANAPAARDNMFSVPLVVE